MILVIDNYDSFTYNLVQYIGDIKKDIVTKRNDETSLKNVKEIRGKGLFNAIEFNDKKNAEIILNNLKENGLLTQITKEKVLRLTPPLIINKKQIDFSLEILEKSINWK